MPVVVVNLELKPVSLVTKFRPLVNFIVFGLLYEMNGSGGVNLSGSEMNGFGCEIHGSRSCETVGLVSGAL